MIPQLTFKYLKSANRQVVMQIEEGVRVLDIEWYLLDVCNFYYYNSGDPHNNTNFNASQKSDGNTYVSFGIYKDIKILKIYHTIKLFAPNAEIISSKLITRLLKLKELGICQEKKY